MSKNVDFQGNFVFFNIPTKYRDLERKYGGNVPPYKLYEATRRAWIMAERRTQKIQYAAAVCGGIVRAVYKVQSWRKCPEPPFENKWEFEGSPTSDASQASYVGKPADPFMPRGAVFVVAYNFK